MGQAMPTVLVVGPASAVGGMSTAVRTQLHSPLCQHFNVICFDNSKRTARDRQWWKGLMSQLNMVRQLLHMLVRHQPGIVHIHTCSGMSFFRSTIDYVSARMCGARVIVHIHGGRFDAFLDGLSRWSRFVVRRVLRGADAVIALSRGWAARLSRFDRAIPIDIVHNAVALPSPRVDADSGSRKSVHVVFVGLLTRAKGIDDLLSAVLRMPDGLRRRMSVQIIGGDPQGRVETLRGAVKKAGLSNTIHFMGQLAPDEVHRELDRADVFVLPSYAEGQPISLLEAMAREVACVAYDVGAVSETLVDGTEGIVLPCGHVLALHDALAELIENEPLRSRYGQAARRRVERDFSVAVMADHIGQVYTRALARGAS